MSEDALTKAAREWDEASQELTAVNKAAKEAKEKVAKAKAKTLALLESREQKGVLVDKFIIKQTELVFARITDREAFEAWAKENDAEAFFEPETRVRTGDLDQYVRELVDNGEALPDGLGIFVDDQRLGKRKA